MLSDILNCAISLTENSFIIWSKLLESALRIALLAGVLMNAALAFRYS